MQGVSQEWLFLDLVLAFAYIHSCSCFATSYFNRQVKEVLEELGIRTVVNYGVTGDCPTCLRIDLLRSQVKRTRAEEEELEQLQRGK